MRAPLFATLRATSCGSTCATLCAVLCALVCVTVASCRRPCETADNCKRSCDCVDATTDTELECTMAFRCETASSECEVDHDGLSCGEVCEQYASVGKCGFQRCNVDQECVRIATCPIRDVNGQPTALNFTCTLNFTCDAELGLCGANSERPLDELCFLTDPATGALLCPQPPVNG